jgi:hypothetical protein
VLEFRTLHMTFHPSPCGWSLTSPSWLAGRWWRQCQLGRSGSL